jgi:NADH-quinone oxidoreductase subunit L
MGIATLAIAGIPPFAGFFSKDEILAYAFGRGQTQPVFLLFWGMGVVAALLTAFYMARLMAMTFFGANRTGEKERGHLHEAPWIMTGPLLVLGLLSIAGGWLNLPSFVPESFGPRELLHRWLEPITAAGNSVAGETPLPHGSAETMLVGLAVVIAVVGLVWGYRATLAKPIPTAHAAPAEVGFWRVLYHKYYIDEFYDAVIVRPLVACSNLLWRRVDQGVIDGAGVNGPARMARALGWLGGQLQTGQLGLYIAVFVVGALYVLGRLVW